MKNIAIIQARMGSTRFPGKVLSELSGKPILQWVTDAASKISEIDQIIVATSDQPQDLPIIEWCKSYDIDCFAGDESDVLKRFYDAASYYKGDIIVRLTADCPLLDASLASQVLYLVTSGCADYASNILPPSWPDGLDCEAFTFQALEYAYKNATRPSDREHVTSYIRNNQQLFKNSNISSTIPNLYKHRWTIDTPEDLSYIQKIIEKHEGNISTYSVLNVINSSPELIQPPYQRNEGFITSLKSESTEINSVKNSHELLQRALKVIPLGSQTFSKSYIQYPQNTSPLFLTHGNGSKVWDADGNEYIDLVSALLPNVLGYTDPDINLAIYNQLQKGISFSLTTELEIELAEKLCSVIPSAEKVRFAKNGTDVTSAAVRLARAFTGRDRMIVCGYHGWQDWYIGTTSRNKGIPQAVSALSTTVTYNNLAQIEELLRTEEFAAIIMEPCNVQAPQDGYLQGIKNACERHGSILIFDEVITGFRFSLGGAQEYFSVTPHLSCFGKAMGNGMPISAIVGRSDIMNEMEEIFFSGTFGGETLSLAAALATIKKIESHNIIDKLWSYGNDLSECINALIQETSLNEVIKLNGYAPWKILQFLEHQNGTSAAVKTFFIQEMIARGILINGSFNVSSAHNELDKYKITLAFKEILEALQIHLEKNTLAAHLKSPPIQPLFKVR